MSEPSLRYYCAQCNQRFTRKEHLQRHQNKHGSLRPFECKQCSQQFTRSDVLRRHESTHKSVDEANGHSQAGSRILRDRKCQRKSSICTLNRPHTAINRRRPLSTQTNFKPSAEDPSISARSPNCDYPSLQMTSQVVPQVTESSLSAPSISSHSGQTTSSVERRATINATDIQATSVTNLSNSLLTPEGNSLPETGSAMPMCGISGQQSLGMDVFDPDVLFSWEQLSTPFQVPSPYVGEGFPHFLWRAEESTLPDNVLEETSTSVYNQAKRARSRGVIGTKITGNPYANCPFGYRFKRGPTVSARQIYEFLHDRASWRQVSLANVALIPAEVSVPRIVESLRDTIAARIHGMLYKLLDRDEFRKLPHLFPPLETIQSFFDAYQKSISPVYPVIHPTTFSESSWEDEDSYADIGIFLTTVMSMGCLVTPVEEARSFSIELGYLIRITITEGAFQDETRLTDKWVVGAWIMIMVFSAWSGIKRHMELAEAYKGILSAFLLRRGYYKAHPSYSPGTDDGLFGDWSAWIDKERDLSVQPSISFTKIRCPMPISDELFLVDNEVQWANLVSEWAKDEQATTKLHPPSLTTFHYLFLRHDFFHLQLSVTPLQLRLLLCTIQAQVTQYSQSHRFVALEERFMSSTALVGCGDFMQLHQQEEFENMLVKWNILAERVFAPQSNSELKVTCLLVSQLVWLELSICFDDVQLIAGKEGYKIGRLYLPQLQQWAQTSSARKAIACAGNVMKILQTSGDDLRPVWWPVAVSRVAMVMWCYSVGLYLSTGSTAGVDDSVLSRVPLISLNDPEKDFDPRGRLLQPGEGIPCIQDSHGTLFPLHKVPELFDHCIQILEDSKGPDSPILESIRQFLQDIKNCGIPYTYEEPASL
ncbi:hypothetical protein V491_05433 [Pseudogymnoascus sp. VKM F-3775]|nr:hypothetical protein V491_05433 [Pseudogymnoascus sp. VKM F-3775]